LTRVPGSRQLILEGTVGAAAVQEEVAVDDPALFAAHALYNALVRRGVMVRGRPMARHGEGFAQGEVLAMRLSPPLSEVLRTMVKVSQNLHAEMLLREVGFVQQGEGSVARGLREVQGVLREMKISADDWRSEDGSGLARNDEVAPRAVTQLLAEMDAGPYSELWRSLLPVGGQDGTLSKRLCCTSEAFSIKAKTGTLTRAVALSGYADSPVNGRLVFSILVNNFAVSLPEVRDWVDKLATILIE
jgi:D-alanyl-D-alanine carboxypeptidase/D-alanyl-D-alanine-endopeptidase (penicillin-binding protein 4)